MKACIAFLWLLLLGGSGFCQELAAPSEAPAPKRTYWSFQAGLNCLFTRIRFSPSSYEYDWYGQQLTPRSYRLKGLPVGCYLGVALNRRLSGRAGLTGALTLDIAQFSMVTSGSNLRFISYDSASGQAHFERVKYRYGGRYVYPHLSLKFGGYYDPIPSLPALRVAMQGGAFVAAGSGSGSGFIFTEGAYGFVAQPSIQFKVYRDLRLELGYRHFGYKYRHNIPITDVNTGNRVRFRALFLGVTF